MIYITLFTLFNYKGLNDKYIFLTKYKIEGNGESFCLIYKTINKLDVNLLLKRCCRAEKLYMKSIQISNTFNFFEDKMEAANNDFGGYDFKTTSKTAAYECPICKKIIRHFTELPCEHFSCRKCLEHWERQKQTNHRQQLQCESLDQQ